ncbi:ATP-binding protein [Planobispora siamensis]|uniref:AAA+ ATPase domain-containing protein n=1 Tax=Planobispora siamensis TaxID=936338 RepID=A0A8J3SN16_9ACTN|nr:ATP-binding protein [Planobispora siamensis]GIH97448.1 hypothetical protein Psi01_80780 [Planobispora siamensis]
MSIRLADRLDSARRRSFVGREHELAAFRDLLDPAAAGRILLVHGAGGVGKTALLHQYAWLARTAGRQVVWLDGHELTPSPEAITRTLAESLCLTGNPLTQLTDVPGLVLLVDTAELLAPLEPWLRRELIPALGAEAIVVLAGRDRPSPVWRVDAGWRELVEVVALGNLSYHEGCALLGLRGVPEEERRPALEFTHGHPLALALVADVSAQRRFSAGATHEVMAALLKSFVDTVPSPLHHQALEACALVLATTEPLLAALLDLPEAGELFAWLRDLSIVEYGSRGLFPHDLAREALEAELRWRDPDGCAQIRRRAAAHYRQQFAGAAPIARQMILLDFVYLHRDTSVLGPFVSEVPGTADLSTGSPTAAELDTIVSWVRKHEGEESARLCELWLHRQPSSVTVVRKPSGEAVGFYQLIVADRQVADPAMAGLPDAGEVRMVRFWMDGQSHQRPSPTHMFITTHLCRSYLTSPSPEVTLLTFAEAEPWQDACAYLDFHRMPEADFQVGERRFAVFGHDWRAVPPLAWICVLAERDALTVGPVSVLDEEAFAEAVKAALRSYGKAGGLRGSALLGSTMVSLVAGDADDPAGAERALRDIIRETAARMEASPRDRRAYRALHHTFLHPASTQADAAELLGLPMSTFRRHLAAGEARFTELLWQRELDCRGEQRMGEY